MNETTDTAELPGHLDGTRPPLRRSVTDRKVAGVAGGLGRYFNIDPLIFRVVFVTLAIFGGSGLLLYAVGWLLVPEDGDNESEVSRLVNGRASVKIVGGIVLAIVGLAVVGNFARTGFGFGGFAALLAVAFAAYLISRNDTGRPLVAPRQGPGPQQPEAYGPAGQGDYGQTPGTAYATAAPAAAPTQPIFYPPPVAPPTPQPRSPLGKVTLSLALVAAGALVAWNLATTHDVPAEVVLAVCLAVVGLGLVVGGFAGRARRLIFVGALLVIATTAAGVAHVGLRGGIGDRSWAPRSVAAVHETYRLGVGQARLDLSHVQFAPGETINVAFRQGVGDLLIVLPARVPVDVVTDVNAGSIRLPRGPEQNGTSVHRRFVDPRDAAPVITIDAQLGVGSMEVRRATS
jgi:phage shock protein PspC (stress-responsive transcriptional regulator)/predicted membrane protein